MGAVDRSAALGEARVDPAAAEVGGVAGELEGDPDVVDVLLADPQRDQAVALAGSRGGLGRCATRGAARG